MQKAKTILINKANQLEFCFVLRFAAGVLLNTCKLRAIIHIYVCAVRTHSFIIN